MRPLERITRLEAAMAPKLPAFIFVDAECQDFAQKLANAKATGIRVFVVHPDASTRAHVVDGIEHIGSLTAAAMRLSHQPSTTGRRTAFDDVIQHLQGVSDIGRAAMPADDVDDG